MTHTLKTDKGTYRCTLRPFNALMQSRYIRIEKEKRFLFFKWYEHYADEPISEIDWEICVLDENHEVFGELCASLVEGQEDLKSAVRIGKLGSSICLNGKFQESEDLPIDPNVERARIYREAKEDHERMGL